MAENRLINQLDQFTKKGELYTKLDNGSVQCHACAHRCTVKPGQRGICQVRFNRDGDLYVPWGYTAGLQADPIEKKPFAHFLPGSDALTFGMLGCNFHCPFCQNWLSSQAPREPQAADSIRYLQETTPVQIARSAALNHAAVIASSYNEPLITTEWAVDIFKTAKETGVKCVYVSDGYGTPEVLDYLKPWLDGIKIDLKSMSDDRYKLMGGRLQPVLDTIKRAYEMGLWLEIVTLVIPDFNDSNEELWEAARFISGLSREIPWHVTAYHPDYKMTDRSRTSAETLQRAADIGQEAGLQHVYAGNLPGRVGSLENTCCPQCQHLLIERFQYIVSGYHISENGTCPECGYAVKGIWPKSVDRGKRRGPRPIRR